MVGTTSLLAVVSHEGSNKAMSGVNPDLPTKYMNIYIKKDKIIVEISKYQDATDCLGQKVGMIDNIIGVVYKDEYGNEEIGFSYLLDRTYKGKEPDISVPFLDSDLEKKEFIELCEKLGIGFFEYPTCETCGKSIFGSFTVDENGKNLCFECEAKMNQRSN